MTQEQGERARPALSSDLDTLEDLWRAAVRELDHQRGGDLLAGSIVKPEPLREALESDMGDPDRLIAVGTLDGVTVGFAYVRCARDRREPLGVIETIYVEPDARQVGVGEEMLKFVMAWCRDRGCEGIDAPALPGSRAAKAFFETNGFVARLLVMHEELRDD